MDYYFCRTLDRPFEEVVRRTRTALETQGFGVVTEIDMAATLRARLGADFRPYLILGACNPAMAREALLIEDKVGVMLPCNVIVQTAREGGGVEVAAIDPSASMQAIDNPALTALAMMVAEKLQAAVALI